MDLNFFDSIDFLEPKCPGCKIVLEYGVNTKYDEKLSGHICDKCGFVLK